jgi:GNAT superfamily N-acetyltransferase
MNLSVHPLAETEFDATDAVLMAAYQVQHSWKENLQRYLALAPGGAFVAKDDGTIAGFGGAMDYGPFAYIGLMAVHPGLQKRGIGQMILEHLLAWLDARGCATVLLDATPVGVPLYERCGFTEDDRTLVLQQDHRIVVPRHLPAGVSTISEKEFPGLVTFDAPCFGAERGALLASYRADDPGRVLVMREANGQTGGYLIAQSRTLGPWVARTTEAAERLLIHALALPFTSEPRVLVSAQHSDALGLLSHYGFSVQRTLSHMCKGERLQRGRSTTLYGQASLGFG